MFDLACFLPPAMEDFAD